MRFIAVSDAFRVKTLEPNWTWTLATLATVAACIFLAATAPAQAENTPVTIRLSTQLPPTIPNYKAIQHFKERVEQVSKGSIIIDLHHSAELYSDLQIGPAVKSGAIEMGFVPLIQVR